MPWDVIAYLCGGLAIVLLIAGAIYRAEARDWSGDDEEFDLLGDHPHIPPDYRIPEHHKDPARREPREPEVRGA
jgi:hypothetical protein